MAITSANQLELLQTAEAVAREKMIEPELVIEAMEEALAKAAKSRYGAEMDIRVAIDRKTGVASFTRVRTVVEDEELENYQAELTVEQAKQYMENPAVGDTLVDEVPPVELSRVSAQSSKQVILQRVREAERERQYEEFKDRAGTIINGLVKREEYGNVIVDIGRGEAVLRRNEKIGRESYRPNDRIRVYIKDVRREPRGPQIFLSRTAPEFMAELFKMEVPEIYDGIIEIKAVARDPGSRAKIAVVSYDGSIDPVGACVGMRGSRVQAVVNELQGEKIDIMTEADESERRQKEFSERTKLFMDTLDLDEFFAQLLVSEGFTSLEEVAYVELEELLVIDGVDEATAEELQARARDNIEAANKAALTKARELGVEDALIDFEGLSPMMVLALAQDGVKTLEDFATCADWELAGGWTTDDGKRVKDDGILEPFDVGLEEAQVMVMTARVQLGWVDPEDLISDADAEEGEAVEISEEQVTT